MKQITKVWIKAIVLEMILLGISIYSIINYNPYDLTGFIAIFGIMAFMVLFGFFYTYLKFMYDAETKAKTITEIN